ncbi:MAG: hypothetical protein FJ146_16060 [Deltaproteobacteria bacterium]|nr:hypothetical protein [Deltaproteobacteria bacterium]
MVCTDRWIARPWFRILAFLWGTTWAWGCITCGTAAAASRVREVDWKLYYNQMFALEIRKELRGRGTSEAPDVIDRTVEATIRQHLGYTPLKFNEVITKVLSANTSAEAYRLRREIYFDQASYAKVTTPNFDAAIPSSLRSHPLVASYLARIQENRDRSIAPQENFFTSPEGINFIQAVTKAQGDQGSQEVTLVLVPGYAAHVIKFAIFPEILSDANRYWGRPEGRPILADRGLDVIYEAPLNFYGSGAERPHPFDILTPSGWELGNTVGFNAETADLLAKWIHGLPSRYARSKFIFLGYSKGGPTIFEMLQRHPELKARTAGVITYAGVLQGTHVARFGRQQISGVLGARSIADLITKIRTKTAAGTLEAIAPFLTAFDLSVVRMPEVKEVLNSYGIDTTAFDSNSDRILEGRELREVVDGLVDLEPLTRARWNLSYFDRNILAPGSFLFNLTAVTDIATFASRRVSGDPLGPDTSIIAPQLRSDRQIDWPNLSLDAWFLYLASQPGFKMAPGGLYDTQVDMQHTKSPWLDTSPLTASLTDEEMQILWDNPAIRERVTGLGVRSLEDFRTWPRSRLMDAEGANQIGAFDLGEFKGHHWSLFLQAFRPPREMSSEFAIWQFPRKAMMRALLQTFALYNLVQQS